MINDSQAILDDILSRWHRWASSKGTARGWAPKALVCGDYRISRQYDDENGALDDDLENALMRDVDFQVGEMAEPYRSAIYANARALVVGCAVFSSPRLPLDREERQRVIDQARIQLINRLTKAGVIG